MKRSEINRYIDEGIKFLEEQKFCLPPFAFWSKEDWATKGEEYDEIRENMLGWDITDFGSGDYKNIGLLLFTIRNGNLKLKKYTKGYAEKVLIADEGQVTPYHFHYHKMEDIINRGGGNLIVKMYNKTEDEKLDDTDVLVSIDGRNFYVGAGETIRLAPGESISIYPYQYHSFWAEEGHGKVLIGEVSLVNNDNVDNRFLEEVGRFPEIDEDVVPNYLMYNDYSISQN